VVKDTGRKFLLIGLDGGTFEVIKPFIKEGYLPNIEKVMTLGSYGILESTIPSVTAPAWASFMTGKNPGKHGIFHFFEFSRDERQLTYNFYTGKFLNFSHIQESTIFELLGENGKKVISINIPMTYPPREIKGKMISCWLTPPGAKDYTFPLSLRGEYPDYRIDQYFGERMFVLTPDGKQIVADEFFSDINDVLDRRAKTALSMIAKENWDLFMICFTETDRVQHFFWRAINPDYPEFDTPHIQAERRLFIDFYKKIDRYIGELIVSAEKVGAAICIMSDHGFGPPPSKRFHLNYYLRKHGYIVPRGSNNDNLSSFLKNIKERVGQYKLGRIFMRDLLGLDVKVPIVGKEDDVDWNRTTAWSVCLNNFTGGIFFNKAAIKIPVSRFQEQLISDIRSIIDPQKNSPIIEKIIPCSEMYSGEKTSNFPDLIYFLSPDYEAGIEGGFDLFATSLISSNPYPSGRGNHNMQGIYCFYGNDIKKEGESGKISIMDILPTVLFYLGVPIPDDLDGRPLVEFFRKEIEIKEKPIYRKIDKLSYKRVSEDFHNNSVSNDDGRAIQEKLKTLGYL